MTSADTPVASQGADELDRMFDNEGPSGNATAEFMNEPVPAKTSVPLVPPAPAPDAPGPDHRVPLRELLDERDKRQRYEREVAEYRRKEQEREAEKQRNPNQMFEDPDAFQRSIEQTMQERESRLFLKIDQRDVRRQHGDVYDEAMKALDEEVAKGNQALAVRFLQDPDSPNEAMVKWYLDNKRLAEIGEPADYEKRIREKVMAELRAQQPAGSAASAGAPQPATLPSLNRAIGNAGQPSGGAISEEEIFDAAPVFGRKKA